MGRYRRSGRLTVEDCRSISIFWLRQNHYLNGFKCGDVIWRNGLDEEIARISITVATEPDFGGERSIRFRYSIGDYSTDHKTHYDYSVPITTTACNYGGVRFWFRCSLSKNGIYCGRRVGVLHLPPGGEYFGCRHCYDLTYKSVQEHDNRVGRVLKNPYALMRLLKDGGGSVVQLKAALKLLDF